MHSYLRKKTRNHYHLNLRVTMADPAWVIYPLWRSNTSFDYNTESHQAKDLYNV